MNAAEDTLPPAAGYGTSADWKIGARAHASSSGPYKLKSIAAPSVGESRPLTATRSTSAPAPSTIPGDGSGVSVARLSLTTTVSPGSLQAPAEAALLSSPLYAATQR